MTGSRFHRRKPVAIRSRVVGLLSIGILAMVAGMAAGQGGRGVSRFYPDSSEAAETLLRNAASHVKARQWSEAVGIYQRVVEQYGDKVARLPRDLAEAGAEPEDEAAGFVLYVDLRGYCQRKLAGLPEEARAVYRKRMDAQAERWYRDGEARRDAGPLRRVVEQAFCTSWGDDALELLGDLAFQDGRFREALAAYRRLAAEDPADPMALVHPDPSVDLARVAAKKLLCRVAAGEPPPQAAEIEAFARRFPGASGPLAGRKGPLAATLAAAIASDHLAPPAQVDGRWPTFAGAPSRNKIVGESIDVGSLQWRVALDKISLTRPGGPYGRPRTFPMNNGSAAPASQLLGYHPIIVGDQVIVVDGDRISGYNLSDRPAPSEGDQVVSVEPAWTHDPDDGGAAPRARASIWTTPRYTVTAVGDRIYARMGSSAPPGFLGGVRAAGADSFIVAVDRNHPTGKPLWVQRSSKLVLPDRPADQVGRSVNFEGSPVADDRAVYVAVTDRREQTATYVACFNAADGSPRWLRYLGAAATDNDNFMAMGGMGFGGGAGADPGHRLLSLDGPVVYYQTNLGALAAIDADTGSIRWTATYPRQDAGRGLGGARDLNPAVVHDGLVFIAPSDASSIFAFEAHTGRLKWKTDAIPDEVKLAHLLGVAKGRLVATGDKVLWFDVRDGKLLHTWPDAGSREGYGRGLLAGDKVYWPTRNEIQVLDQAGGGRSGPPIKLLETYGTTGGNLVAGDGYLVVAQSDALVVFCQNSRLIERYRDEIARAPDRATPHYRLARAAEAVGDDQQALDSYEQSIRHAGADETIDGAPLVDVARDHQLRLLMRLATTLRKEKKYEAAVGMLEAAVTAARRDQDRLNARLSLADAELERGRPAEAVALLERLLGDEGLVGLTVGSDDGRHAVRADLFVGDRLAAIIHDHGRAVYAQFDRQARALLDRGANEKNTRSLAEVARAFPVAEVVPEALLALAAVHEARDEPSAAAVVYKRLLTLSAPSDVDRARALWRLARVYESQGYLVSARDAYLQLADRYPRVVLEEGGTAASVADRATAELAREPLTRLVADRPRPALPSPMARRWSWKGGDASESAAPLTAAGAPPSADASRVFLTDDAGLSPLDPADGGRGWTTPLGERAVWVGYLADKLLAATPHQVAALDLRTGAVQWRFGRGDGGRARRGPDPFTHDDRQPNPGPNTASAAALAGFEIVGGRLFLLRGDAELIALDGDTGLIDWSYTSRGGAINPNLWIGPARLVLQADAPRELVVLDTEGGRLVSRLALADGEGLERAPVPLDDEHVIVVTDRRTLKKLDLERGRYDWEYRESADMPVNGAPRVFADAERLLVIHDGRTLIRLDPTLGAKKWSTVLGTEDLGERPDALAFDDRRFYCVCKSSSRGGRRVCTLRALSLENGAAIWSRQLTGRDLILWSLALSDHSVIVYPSLSSLWEEEVESMPVVVCKQENGALVQRFVFPATIAGVRLRLDSRGAMIATPRELWALGARPPFREGGPSPTP